MIFVESIPGRGGMKKNGGGDNSSTTYLIHCKNFVNATMYPQPAQQ
jgi:hypothetical protein